MSPRARFRTDDPWSTYCNMTQNPQKPAAVSWSSRIGKLGPVLLFAAAIALVFVMGWHRQLSLETLVRNRADLDALLQQNYASVVLGFFAIYVTAVALSLPGAVFLTIASGVLFGWIVGGVVTVVAATIGATLVFLIARSALADFVARRIGTKATKLAEGFRADSFNYLLFVRLVPFFPFWLVNLAAAVFGMSLGSFVLATALGIVPGTFAFAAFGAGLDSIIGSQEAA
ncbi:MAG: hypothetical protein QOD74_938, partial [Variibacter sp.]|nr:hypothetical protein [Variibacter sp.]